MLEKVQCISSVSGGSLATYFAARKLPRSEPMLGSRGLSPVYEQFFKDYRAAMQENFEQAALWRQVLFFRAFNPTKAADQSNTRCGTAHSDAPSSPNLAGQHGLVLHPSHGHDHVRPPLPQRRVTLAATHNQPPPRFCHTSV